MVNVALVRSIKLKAVDKMEIGLLSNQDITTSLFQACVWYQSCFLNPLFKSIVKVLSHLYDQPCKSMWHAPQPSKDPKIV